MRLFVLAAWGGLGLILIAHVADGLRRGRIFAAYTGWYDESDSPVWFWIWVVTYVLLSIMAWGFEIYFIWLFVTGAAPAR